MCIPGHGRHFYVSARGFHQVSVQTLFVATTMQKLNKYQSQADPAYPCADNARILGLCTGALAAAAVSCSRSTLNLIPMAVEAVIVAFRIGMHVTDVGKRLETSQEIDQSWSMIVAGSASSEIVHRFCEQTVRRSSFCFTSMTSSSVADLLLY